MVVENVWVVSDGNGNYFAGLQQSSTTENQVAVFAPMSNKTHFYKNKKSVAAAFKMAQSLFESPYIVEEYVEHAEFPDKPKTDDLQRISEEEQSGWVCLDRLCGKVPAILRKNDRLGIVLADKKMYYLPTNERLAWKRYFRECEQFVLSRIENRTKKEP